MSAGRTTPLRLLRAVQEPAAATYILSDYGRRYLTAPASVGLHAIARLAYAVRSDDLASSLLMRAHRAAPAERITADVVKHRDRLIEYSVRYVRSIPHPSGWTRRCIVLRMPQENDSVRRKGVLLVKFTRAAAAVAALVDVERLCQHFHVVLEPSWAGYCSPEIMAWCQTSAPVVVQCSARCDRELLSRLGTNLEPVEFGSSDWVDHRIFRPLNLERRFDSVYVANLSRNKRLHAYLRAVATIAIRNPGYHGAVVCGEWGGYRDTLESLVELYGVQDHVALYYQLPQAELNEILNLSKVNVLMSLKEGSNKSLFESMFAGTPVLALRDNVSINHDYINEHTGKLASHDTLVEDLAGFRDNWNRYRPREWALAHISPQATTQKLAAVLRRFDSHSDDRGADELLVKVNSPEATYWDSGALRAVPDTEDLLRPFMHSKA